MSRKLATIIKDSKVPGKYKRVAEAYAAFANNDGSNIYPTKKKLAAKAGAASPDTIYRNTPDLLACGLISEATSHTCRVEACRKGRYHFTGRQGKYTTAYNLHLENLQNAETYLSAKCLNVNAAKSRKVLAANCGTDSGIKETPARLGKTLDSSALTSGVGLLVSSDDSLRSSSSNVAATPATPKTKIPPIPDTDELTWEEHHAIVKFEDETFRLLGLPQSEERHYPDMKRIAAVLVYRKRNHRWLLELVRWMKEHKAFWAKRLHAGDRAVGQLANFLETGECATQFDAYLALKDPDMLEAGLYDLTVEAVIHNSEPVTVGRGFDLEEAE